MFGLVLLLVFLVEGTIMLLLPHVMPWPRGSLAESGSDATLLSVVLAPALWFVVVRPLRELYRERGTLLNRVFEAQERERFRIARDLHDELGQHLTAMLVGLRALMESTDSDLVRGRAAELSRMTSASMSEVKKLANGLRPGVLEDFGLAIALQRLGEDFQTAHQVRLSLRVELPVERRYSREVETAAYRVVQESLTNIARHSHAQRVDACVKESRGLLSIEIADDGRGIQHVGAGRSTEVPTSMGLTSMRERVELLGGRFSFGSSVGRGTQVKVSLPALSAKGATVGASTP